MIPYEQFDSNISGHFSYALSLPLEDALTIAGRRLNDGTWVKDARGWTNLVLVFRGSLFNYFNFRS